MPDPTLSLTPETREMIRRNDRSFLVHNYRLGCILGIVFSLSGAVLDTLKYRDQFGELFLLRLMTATLLFGLWCLLGTNAGKRFYRPIGLIEIAIPMFFNSLTIYLTDGVASTYYAGINLVLMGASIVLKWTALDSVITVALGVGMYTFACLAHQSPFSEDFPQQDLVNNLFFISVTGVFTIFGNYYYTRFRHRDLVLRHELDLSRSELETSNQKLLELDKVRMRFLANISHELRTPLTLLIAPLETLLKRADTKTDRETVEYLTTMHTNGMRLLKLINDLLELVRLDTGNLKVNRSTLDVEKFLSRLVSSIKHVADEKGITLTTKITLPNNRLVTDVDKLEKALLNLVFNATKFTGAGGSIEIRVQAVDPWVEFQVRDTGVGIAADQLPFVFDRFWQADTSAHRKYQGTGIGLALVKELIEAQEGTVSAASVPDAGTTMTVRIPQLQPSNAIDQSSDSSQSDEPTPIAVTSTDDGDRTDSEWVTNLYRRADFFRPTPPLQDFIRRDEYRSTQQKPKLLVVDDEPDMLDFLNIQLKEKFEIIEATDGDQALQKARQFLPEIILCDMMMPGKDGIEVCQHLQEDSITRSIPFVLLTARADEDTKLRALEFGASDFLTKPFSSTELDLRLSNLVESRKLQRELTWEKKKLEATLEQLKETESQLVQSEKMASLGRMSAGIIHEINNPLNYANIALYTLKGKEESLPTGEREEFTETLKDVEDAIKRIANIVSDLRTFSHTRHEALEDLDLASVVELTLRFLAHQWRDQVNMDVRIPPGFTLSAARNRLTQGLINLLQNALDSVMDRPPGTDEATIRIEASATEQNKQIVIRDNGRGISPEDLDRIFEPFYTTKDVGEGMGLGLSICYQIIEEMGGTISVQSKRDEYCEFKLEFPIR